MYLRRHNRYQDAVPIMDAAVKLADATYTGNSSGRCRYAAHLNQLGKLHFELGNFLEAERLGTVALELIRNFCHSKVQIAAGFQILSRAMQYQDIGPMPYKKKAYIEYLLHETFNIKQDILKDVSPEMTDYRMDIEFRMYLACHNMGQFYQDLERYDLALDYLLLAKEIWKPYENGTAHWRATWLISIAAAETTRARNYLLQDKIWLNPYLQGFVWRILERAVEVKGRHLADSNTSHQLGLYYLCRMAKKFPTRTHTMRVSALKYQEELKRVDTSGVFQKMLNTEFTQLHEEFPSDDLVWM
ncbi:uncharacterized protein LOC106152857 [Lingula anatina]|uniref:Uncharacterized protein LOC106152857 n=1 Tax=Lingula anatina TaxID=7574 RepID=A0A1S3H7T8_LINAN|nr:uncharacterized protein LOC106152857 [Lingula anatina]|eukprot:XP_013382047.1 uncharacterized protein LOC106152857 [Lingula anatina]